jgi:hypothetical protein
MIEEWQHFEPIEPIKPSIDLDHSAIKIIYLLKDLEKYFLAKAVTVNRKLDRTNRKDEGS